MPQAEFRIRQETSKNYGMIIGEKYQELKLFDSLQVTETDRDGISGSREDDVITEHLMDVYINEHLTMKLTCTPSHLAELVLGRLLTEGIVESTEEVDHIYVCEYGRRARVFLKGYDGAQKNEQKDLGEKPDSLGKDAYVEMTPSCCTGNHILNDYFVRSMQVKPVDSLSWKRRWIFHLMDVFEADTPLHSRTGSTHSCYLMIDGEIMFRSEDIGRHNALDKVIGYALRHGLDLTKAIVYTTGRIPTDMAMKALRAGIPVLVSRKKPTAEALQLAAEYGLTIIGEAKKNKMLLYGDSFRID